MKADITIKLIDELGTIKTFDVWSIFKSSWGRPQKANAVFLLGFSYKPDPKVKVVCFDTVLKIWSVTDEFETPKGNIGKTLIERSVLCQPKNNANSGLAFIYNHAGWETVPLDDTGLVHGENYHTTVQKTQTFEPFTITLRGINIFKGQDEQQLEVIGAFVASVEYSVLDNLNPTPSEQISVVDETDEERLYLCCNYENKIIIICVDDDKWNHIKDWSRSSYNNPFDDIRKMLINGLIGSKVKVTATARKNFCWDSQCYNGPAQAKYDCEIIGREETDKLLDSLVFYKGIDESQWATLQKFPNIKDPNINLSTYRDLRTTGDVDKLYILLWSAQEQVKGFLSKIDDVLSENEHLLAKPKSELLKKVVSVHVKHLEILRDNKVKSDFAMIFDDESKKTINLEHSLYDLRNFHQTLERQGYVAIEDCEITYENKIIVECHNMTIDNS